MALIFMHEQSIEETKVNIVWVPALPTIMIEIRIARLKT